MSNICTIIHLRAAFGAGRLEYGRHSRESMIAKMREGARADIERATKILAAPDADFNVRIVRGVQVQHLVDQL